MHAIEPYLDAKTHVIWDWNGTLLNDLDLCFELTCVLLHENGLPQISKEHHRRHFGLPVASYYEHLGFDLERVPFKFFAEDFMRRYHERVRACSLFEGAQGLLSRLAEKKKRQSILSAAPEVELKELTRHFDIEHYFEFIFGLSDQYAASKIERGFQLISRWDVTHGDIILVGDTDHDLEVGRELGIEVLLLADGHQSYERLRAFPNTLACRYSGA